MGLRIHTDAELAAKLRELDQPRRTGVISAAEKLAAGEAASVIDQIAKLRIAVAAAAGDPERLVALDTFMEAMKEPRRG